jgi:hypothetical protein
MSLSEIFNSGSQHPWANLRFNNLKLDGTLSTGGGLITTYTNNLITTDILTHIFLTIPVTNPNSVYQVDIKAIAYSTSGSPGYGAYCRYIAVYSIVGGSLLFATTIDDTSTPFGYSGAFEIGIIVNSSPTSLQCAIINENIGQTTNWTIITQVISNIIQ